MKCEYCGGEEGLKVVCSTCLGEKKADGEVLSLYAQDVPAFRSSYVRSLRRSTGLSQAEFAAKAGIGKATLARWESEATTPSESKVQELLRLTKEISDGEKTE